jgi:eukaryotic-like serine/threonine-protein kinase
LTEDEVLALSEGAPSRELLHRVECHLDLCVTCLEVVSRLIDPNETGKTLPAPQTSGRCRLSVGHVLAGRYRLDHFVARGGMGEVYAAYDCELQRPVALKLSRQGARARARASRQLSKEFELARRIQHPNVCRVHDLGVHSDGRAARPRPFLTMDLIEGERLGQRLRRGKLALVDVCRIARQLLLGLDAMHDAGVLHLDLKSDNIMLHDGGAVIVDFGLARPIQGGAESGKQCVAGTLAYMAPDLALGYRPTPQVDVYSFGVVVFEMLAGRLPFGTETLSSCRSVAARLTECPPPPSHFDPRVNPELDRFVLRCLAGQRSDRYTSARAALAVLEGVTLERP